MRPHLDTEGVCPAMNTVDLLRRLDEEFFQPALCTGAIEFSGRTAPVDVLAISAHSADLRCGDDIVEDGPVTLSIDGFRRFHGELVRRHRRIIGMIFKPTEEDDSGIVVTPAQPADSAQPSAGKPPAGSRPMRQHPRSAVFWSGTVQAGRDSVDCIVLNMSPGGAKVKLLKRFVSDGSPMVLHIDRMGGYAGEIVWAEGDTIGLRFLKDPRSIAADIEKALGRTGKAG